MRILEAPKLGETLELNWPLVAALFVSFFAFFLSPILGLVAFLVGQTLAFYAAGKSR